jgi:hypothetical protein
MKQEQQQDQGNNRFECVINAIIVKNIRLFICIIQKT